MPKVCIDCQGAIRRAAPKQPRLCISCHEYPGWRYEAAAQRLCGFLDPGDRQHRFYRATPAARERQRKLDAARKARNRMRIKAREAQQ